MKKRCSVALVLVVGLGTVWWLCLHKPPSPISQSTATDSPSVSQRRSTPIDSKAGAPSPAAPTPNPSHISGDAESPVSEDVTRYIQNVRADPTYDWKQAITFYGKV